MSERVCQRGIRQQALPQNPRLLPDHDGCSQIQFEAEKNIQGRSVHTPERRRFAECEAHDKISALSDSQTRHSVASTKSGKRQADRRLPPACAVKVSSIRHCIPRYTRVKKVAAAQKTCVVRGEAARAAGGARRGEKGDSAENILPAQTRNRRWLSQITPSSRRYYYRSHQHSHAAWRVDATRHALSTASACLARVQRDRVAGGAKPGGYRKQKISMQQPPATENSHYPASPILARRRLKGTPIDGSGACARQAGRQVQRKRRYAAPRPRRPATTFYRLQRRRRPPFNGFQRGGAAFG